jgi:hypothetical protein
MGESGYDPDIPFSYQNLEDARNGLDYIQTRATRMAESLPKPPPTRFSAASDDIKLSLNFMRNFSVVRLRQWSSAFENLLKDKHDLEMKEQVAVRLLQLHRVQMELHLTIDLIRRDDEMVWDEYLGKFEAVILRAEDVLQSLPENRNRPTFTLNCEIIIPLFFAAVKCRHSVLRWKAIAL